MKGIWGSNWAEFYGMKHFINFFDSYYFLRILKNTITISLSTLIFGFPASIILALLLNELKNVKDWFRQFLICPILFPLS